MFKCSAGHTTKLYEDMILVVRKQRKVENLHKIYRNGKESTSTGTGYETVEEKAYCFEHLPENAPEIVEEVVRKHIFKVTVPVV